MRYLDIFASLCRQHWFQSPLYLSTLSLKSNVGEQLRQAAASFGRRLLTEREQQVAALMVQGLDSQEIAEHLGNGLLAALITQVILNCFLVQLLAAMSVYTLGYPVSTPWLAWLNDPMAVMLLIYTFIFASLLITKFDRYMHDLYQLGKLFKKKAV